LKRRTCTWLDRKSSFGWRKFHVVS